MPKVMLGRPKRDAMKELLWGVLAVRCPSGETCAVAKILDCSEPTARKRIRDPMKMPLSELLTLTRALDIPLEEVRQAISY